MHVIATAGHVDHGKSTLVKALTGADPDRLEEEHRRGLSIQLGYCWTSLPPVGEIAFVDVPGHEKFISTMLSGIGPVPAVLFVVAADDPWMPQAAEHLAALDALGTRHGVVAVTRSDLADPAAATSRVSAELARTSLRGAPVVAVSGHNGEGLDVLRAHLVDMVASLPTADPGAPVRLWVDRRFTIRGAGTVVTGTLPAGRISVGDELTWESRSVRVRGVQSLEKSIPAVEGVARVALNLAGDDLRGLDRGAVLVSPGRWHFSEVADVRLGQQAGRPRSGTRDGDQLAASPPVRPLLHIGAAFQAVHCRPLDAGLVRLTLEAPLPLRVGDRALLRDPGSRQVWGITVLDPAPPSLRRRGAAAARAAALASATGTPDLAAETARRGVVSLDLMRRIGVPVTALDDAGVSAGGWLLSAARAAELSVELEALVREHDRRSPLAPGVALAVIAERLRLPSSELAAALIRPPLQLRNGAVVADSTVVLPAALERAIELVHKDLAANPFAAPTAERLQQLGLDVKSVGAAVKAQRLFRPAAGIVLLPGADRTAATWLADLPQPFTTSQARVRLDTSRRVVLPLLAYLDKVGLTRRLPDDRRHIVAVPRTT